VFDKSNPSTSIRIVSINFKTNKFLLIQTMMKTRKILKKLTAASWSLLLMGGNRSMAQENQNGAVEVKCIQHRYC